MQEREAFEVFVSLVSEAIEQELIDMEHDSRQLPHRFYELVDIRNTLLTTFSTVCPAVPCAAPSEGLTVKLGEPVASAV
jgi:hypothetical protein